MRRRISALAFLLGMLLVGVWWSLRPSTEPVPPTVPVPPPPTPPPSPSKVETVRPVVQLPRGEVVDAGTPAECALAGRVVSHTSQAGIAGAELSFEHAGTVSSVRTNADGDFELTTPMDGPWSLAAIVAPGFHPYAPEWGHSPFEVHLQKGTRVAGLRFVLSPQVDYRGEVVGPAGEAIGGAEIAILGGKRALVGPPEKKVSGPDGKFLFQAEDGAVLVARHPKYAPARATLDFAATVTHVLTLRLRALEGDAGQPARVGLKGRVVDGLGQAVPSALVSLQPADAEGDQPDDETLTDADGKFRFVVDPGAWDVTARADGLVPASATVVAPGADTLLTLKRGGRIRGHVEDAYAQPISAFTIVVSVRKGPIARTDAVTRSVVDARGMFAIDGLADGPYAVTAHAAGYAPSDEVKADVVNAGEASAMIRLGRGGKVAGQVVDRKSRAPLEGARVALENTGTEQGVQIAGETRTNVEGRFVLEGVPARRVSVFIAAQDHHARILSALDVHEGKLVQVGVVDLGAVEKGEPPRIELVGIGAVLKAEGDGLTLVQVIPEGGAAVVGLVAGDVLLQIDGENAAKLGFGGGIEKIRGPEGSSVHLKVRRPDSSVIEIDVPRRRIESK